MADQPESPPGSVLVSLGTARVYVGASVFAQYAAEYLAAAQAVPVNPRHSPVPYYLYCHAIELALKCFLRAQRVPLAEIRSRKKLGHDLVRLHERAVGLQLSRVLVLSATQLATLHAANTYYAEKDFEYMPFVKTITGLQGLPPLADLQELAATIVAPMQRVGVDASHTTGPLFP